jgi:membrane fusion protein (multidrug efflux system)
LRLEHKRVWGRLEMLRKVGFTIVVLVAIIAGLGFLKFEQIQAAVKAHAFTPPPTAVTTIIAKQQPWATSIKAVGSAVAVQGVTVSADLPGIVDKITFDSGRPVHAGDVLVELDTRQERAQLAAAEAESKLANLNFERTRALVEQGAVPRADFDKTAAEKGSTEAKVAEIKATIQRKTIHAPFTGVLGIRQVNLGQYLAAGNAIVPLQSLDPIYVNFGVPQDEASKVKVGQMVDVNVSDLPGHAFQGKVTAIDSVIDEATRNVRVQATLSNPKGQLRPGMFVDATLKSGASQSLISLPASAISYAPFGDSVYVVTELKDPSGKMYKGVQQQFVKVDHSRGDQVAIASGLKPGDEVVTSGTFRLRNGAPINVQNNVQPSNNPAPKPEDN